MRECAFIPLEYYPQHDEMARFLLWSYILIFLFFIHNVLIVCALNNVDVV